MKTLLAFLAIALTALPSQAKIVQVYTPAYDICQKASDGITVKVRDCIKAEHKIQDRNLNQLYRIVKAKLSQQLQEKLQQTQRHWIAYRDMHCDMMQIAEGGGTLGPVLNDECVLQLTISRIEQLEKIKSLLLE